MKSAIRILCALILAAVFPMTVAAQPAEAGSAAGQPGPILASGGPVDPAELEAFLDGIMAAHLETHHIAGAVVAVVRDGKLFFAKGYGYADVKAKKPVVPERTLFRIASVSKLFTWTAVMQLAEQGKLDLRADVNTYLEAFKIPDTFPRPITLADLMSHTPGFEDIMTYRVRAPGELMKLGDFLAAEMPHRVWPPGEFTAYSNYSTGLAGYIVERVSGLPFEDYIEQKIYGPLGMTRSTFRQPLPEALLSDMAEGYTYKNGEFKADGFELLNGDYPAGSMSTTAADIARFMIAHLQNGEYEGRRILEDRTARLMHSRLFSHDPRTNGNAHGFWEKRLNGLALLEHGGDIKCFHTLLMLIPERNAGFFVSYNSAESSGFTREQLFQAFLDRYYPGPAEAELRPGADVKSRLKTYAGSYEMNRRSYTTYAKLIGLITPVNFSAAPEGALLMKLPAGLGVKRFVEVESDVFREAGGQGTMVFRRDGRGRVTHAFYGKLPEFALVKLKGYQSPGFHIFLAALSALFFLSAALGWPARALRRKLCPQEPARPPGPRGARWIAGLMSALLLLFAIGVGSLLSNTDQVEYGVPMLLKIILAFPVVAAVLAVGALVYAFLAWKKGYWTPCARVGYTLVLVFGVAFLWLLNFWNLLGWKL